MSQIIVIPVYIIHILDVTTVTKINRAFPFVFVSGDVLHFENTEINNVTLNFFFLEI